MILNSKMTVDPRDVLDRSRRRELVEYAQANGLVQITEAWPADLIREELRARGLTRIPVTQHRPIGAIMQVRTYPLGKTPPAPPPPSSPNPNGITVSANADLRRQFLQEQAAAAASPPPPLPAAAKPVEKMGFNDLQKFCTENKIPRARKENTESLRAKVKAFLDG